MPSSALLEYFDNPYTQHTVTGATWGAEIETHFVDRAGYPISISTTRQLLAVTPPGPWLTTIDLGNQLIEFVVGPQTSPEALLDSTHNGLGWLYRQAARHGAFPVLSPTLPHPNDQNLLWIQDERDQVWCQLDGQAALEHLCRVASVQITTSVHPSELVQIINALWRAKLHIHDYAENDAAWRRYIADSTASYRSDRYAGPGFFEDLGDYAGYLQRQSVVMLHSQPSDLDIRVVPNLNQDDLDLFVRSIWPHYRARVFDGPGGARVSAVEMRPFARRDDSSITTIVGLIVQALAI